MAVLSKLVPGDVGQRDLLLALVGLRAGIGLVVAGSVAGVPDEPQQVFFGGGDVG